MVLILISSCSYFNRISQWYKLNSINKNPSLKIPISHGSGNYFADESTIKELINNNRIAFQYSNQNGLIDNIYNPNGSVENIAGILNEHGNVLGMMPHPERVIDNCLSSNDGSYFFENLLSNMK